MLSAAAGVYCAVKKGEGFSAEEETPDYFILAKCTRVQVLALT